MDINQIIDHIGKLPEASKNTLKEIISEVEPAILIPVHTLHPELEENPYGERILPKRGQTIVL